MLTRVEIKIVLAALIVLVPLTAGLATYVFLQIRESNQFTNNVNGYVQPKWLGYEITEKKKSLVTVDCEGSLGSGFAFDLDKLDLSSGFSFRSKLNGNSSYIVTNAHVIENCKKSTPKIIIADKSSGAARIVSVDFENDLALLITNRQIPPLFGSYSPPRSGFWVMALGSAHSFAGSVTFGNIINRDSNLLFSTASLSPGNSGGPLIDNEGYVFGVNTGAKPVGQNFNISVGVNAFCEKLITCPYERYWQED